GDLARIHDRTPVMLPRHQVDTWLDTSMDSKEAAAAWINDDSHLLEDSLLTVREVDPAVGKVGNEGPELLEPPQRML
ncbi:MAG: SOS response-associated peptidase, partial [Pseudoxanthomonas suwonensis]